MGDHTRRTEPCEFPVVERTGGCCGTDPCSLEWEWPCEAEGGCLDRATCGGCATPVWPASKANPAVEEARHD